MGLADNLQKTWEAEEGVDWASRYSFVTLAATVTATDSFALGATVRKLSMQEGDFVTVTLGTNTWYYDIVDSTRWRFYAARENPTSAVGLPKIAARFGSNLKFSTPFVAGDAQIGGTIVVPAYTYVGDLDGGADTIQVDDPMWLVYMMAAEYVRNDTVKQNQYANLVAKANDRMNAMKRNNGSQLEEVPVLTSMVALGETWT